MNDFTFSPNAFLVLKSRTSFHSSAEILTDQVAATSSVLGIVIYLMGAT